MVTMVELTRFKVAPDKTEALLAARPGMLADFRADREGFLGARLVRLPGDEWLDIVEWRSAEDFAASRAKGPNLPGIAAFFAAIDELVSDEQAPWPSRRRWIGDARRLLRPAGPGPRGPAGR
jgi:quinol monooxygenase YgiN